MGVETITATAGDWDDSSAPTPKGKDAKLIKRIQDDWKYVTDAWRETRDQAEKDQRAVSISGPWSDEEREARKAAGRPCVHLDQISQYGHALVNQVRNKPIAIRVNPSGEGADDTTAQLRSKRIRAIEYESNAQQAYQTAFEAAVRSSFGAVGVIIEYKDWKSRQKTIKIRRIPNIWSWYADPDCKEADWSDMRFFFLVDRIPKDEYERLYPDSSIGGFGGDEIILSDWADDETVQVAEYWYIDKTQREVVWVTAADGSEQQFFMDEVDGWKLDKKAKTVTMKDGTVLPLVEYRKTDEPRVKMAKTNGREILEDVIDWPGKTIPFAVITGPERYIRVGNRVKKQFESYIRMARDPQMLFDYYVSAEAEAIGKVPKSVFLGYKGQFKETYWEQIHKVPRVTAEIEPMRDEVTDQLLPLPQFITYEPPINAIEIGKESARRSIQSSMAAYSFTKNDDTNVKSGRAIEKLNEQRDLGSFHFVDGYQNMIKRIGNIVNDLLDDVEGNETMDVALMDENEKQSVVKLNSPGPDGRPVKYRLDDEGQHEVTIATGPSYQSQREQGEMFADSLINNMQNLPIDPPTGKKLLAQTIKLKQLGPIGDEMAKTIDPEAQGAPDPQKLMADVQKWMQLAEQLGQKIQMMEQERMSNIRMIESQEKIAALKADTEKFKAKLDAVIKHEQLSSKENLEATRMAFEKEEMELQARIDAVAAEDDMAS